MTVINPATGTEWTPEFEGQRPPFQPGNQLAVTHGAFSARRTDPIARRLIEEVTTDPSTSYLASPKYHAMLWQWAQAAAKVEVLSEWVDTMAIQQAADSDRGKTSALELLRKWMSTSMTLADKLGFTPAAAARLGKDVAQGRQADAATLLTRARAEAEANTSST
jgi:hypothetical protein